MKGTITVIDDDVDLRNLLQIALKMEGFEVTAFSSGHEFLDSLSSSTPSDLYVIDINLGGMTGFEVCRKIKADHKAKNSRVILISANPEVQDQTKDVAADDYIMKPFSQRELISRIIGLIGQR
jgi:DNA-binding response OmpR family regulator